MESTNRILSRTPHVRLGLAVVILVGGCGTEPSPVPAAVTVSPDSATLPWFDETVQLATTVEDSDGRTMQDVTVTWISGDESVVTVNARGLVTAVGRGVATVRAVAGGVEGLSAIVVAPDRRALRMFYEATGGTGWEDRLNWGTDAPLGEWHGVTTDSRGNVVRLGLGSNRLTGTIPTETGVLGALQDLQLNGNDLTGPIPAGLGDLENLRILGLNRNALTGRIPGALGDLPELESLTLSGNALTGPIPAELGDLENLRILELNANALTGRIPGALGNLPELESLALSGNALTGPIPAELGNLRDLQRLLLSGNDLTGPVPPELIDLERLQYLTIDNTLLSGRLPRELIGLPLDQFHWNQTELCSPADMEFQRWLQSIPDHRENRKCPS